MSYVHVQQLQSVRREYDAADAATAYLTRVWHRLGDESETRRIHLAHVQEAAANLEITYIIRLFSEFEAILYHHLVTRHPGLRIPGTTEALINRVAVRERIPDPVRDAAQMVREYRNAIVHRRAACGPLAPPSPMSFQQAMARLNRFVAQLP